MQSDSQSSESVDLVSELHEQFGNQLLAFCRSQMGFHDGQEAYQAVWLKVMKNVSRFDGANARAWLYAIARNTIHDARKKRKPKLDSELVERGADKKTTTTLDGLIDSELGDKFRSCLDQLEPLKRKLLQLRVLGESYKSIAATLSIPMGTVGSRFSRVKDELKTCIEG